MVFNEFGKAAGHFLWWCVMSQCQSFRQWLNWSGLLNHSNSSTYSPTRLIGGTGAILSITSELRSKRFRWLAQDLGIQFSWEWAFEVVFSKYGLLAHENYYEVMLLSPPVVSWFSELALPRQLGGNYLEWSCYLVYGLDSIWAPRCVWQWSHLIHLSSWLHMS